MELIHWIYTTDSTFGDNVGITACGQTRASSWLLLATRARLSAPRAWLSSSPIRISSFNSATTEFGNHLDTL